MKFKLEKWFKKNCKRVMARGRELSPEATKARRTNFAKRWNMK